MLRQLLRRQQIECELLAEALRDAEDAREGSDKLTDFAWALPTSGVSGGLREGK
tara:strand:+ start:191 stop:352 length:162 start_codon:yes stop_codon:yes gene_type:complete